VTRPKNKGLEDKRRLPKKAGSKDDFLFQRCRIFSKFTYFSFRSLHQVMITSFSG
jgi:hypothetical protein